MFHYQPSWRKYYKITYSKTRIIWLSSQNCKDWRVRMIEWYRTNSIKLFKIIFVGNIISMPRYNIKYWMIHLCYKELSIKFVYDCERFIHIFIPSNWELKVSWISKTVRSYWTEIGNDKVAFVDLHKPSSSVAFTFNCKLNSSLYYCNLFWFNSDNSVLSSYCHLTFLRNKQHVSVWVVESFIFHWSVESKQMNTDTLFQSRLSSST